MRVSRQNKILELIAKNDVETQEQLTALLAESGYNVTQSTISKDIRELQLIKGKASNGKYKYVTNNYQARPISERFIRIFRDCTLSYQSAQNLIIVKTLPGCSGAACEAIDCLSLRHMVGSISGDNTLLIIIDREENVPEVLTQLDKIMESHEL